MGRVQRLLTYVTKLPNGSEGPERCFRFPILATEFFHQGLPRVLDLVIAEEDLFDAVLEPFSQNEVNSTVAGYACTVLDALLVRNTKKVLKYLYFTGWHVDLSKHLACSSLRTVFLHLVQLAEGEAVNETTQLVTRLVNGLHGDRLTSASCREVITQLLGDSKCVDQHKAALSLAYQGLRSEQSWTTANSAEVVASLIRARVPVPGLNADIFTEIAAALEIPGDSLGEARLAYVKLLEEVSSYAEYWSQLQISQVLVSLTRCFFAYEWNSLLHNSFSATLTRLLMNKAETLVHQVLNEGQLAVRLVELFSTSTTVLQKKPVRKGLMAQAHQIAALLDSNKVTVDTCAATPGWLSVQSAVQKQTRLEQPTLSPPLSTGTSSDEEVPSQGGLERLKQKNFQGFDEVFCALLASGSQSASSVQ